MQLSLKCQVLSELCHKFNLTFSPNPPIILKLTTELKMSDGYKVILTGLSKNKGVVWINWDGINTHILISDLDGESQAKVAELEVEAMKNL